MVNKTLTVSELRTNLADSLDSIKNDEVLIVTRRGKKEKIALLFFDINKLNLIFYENTRFITTKYYRFAIHF
jgi:hypothetical protein